MHGAKKVGVASTRLARVTNDVTRATAKAAKGSRQWARETARLDSALGRTVRNAQRAQRSLRAFGRERARAFRSGGGSFGGNMIGAAAGGMAMRSGFTSSLSMEDAEVRLGTAINAQNKKAAVKKARKSATTFAKNAPVNEVDIMDVNYALNSAGLDADTARAGANEVVKVAKITNGAPERVAEVMAMVLNNLGDAMKGDGPEKMRRIGELLTKTQLKFQFRDFGQLGEALAYSVSEAASAKVPFEELLVALGQLNNSGVTGSRSGTGFNAVQRNMTKAAEEFGFEIIRTADGQMKFSETLKELDQALYVYDNLDERRTAVQNIFGDEGKVGLLPLLKSLKQADADLQDVKQGSVGITDSKFKNFVTSRRGQIDTDINNFRLLGSAITDSMLPVVDALSGPIKDLVGGLTDAVKKSPSVGVAIGTVVAGLTALKGVGLARAGLGMVKGFKGGSAAVETAAAASPYAGLGHLGGGAAKGAAKGGGSLLAKGGSLLKGGGKLLGRLAAPIALLSYVPDLIDGISSGSGSKIGGAIGGGGGGLGGALAGGAAGAAIGSVVPIIGTAIGGIAGSIIGGIGGSLGGESLGEWLGSFFNDQPGKTPTGQAGDQIKVDIVVNGTVGQDPEALALAVKDAFERDVRRNLHD